LFHLTRLGKILVWAQAHSEKVSGLGPEFPVFLTNAKPNRHFVSSLRICSRRCRLAIGALGMEIRPAIIRGETRYWIGLIAMEVGEADCGALQSVRDFLVMLKKSGLP
jgi:hypothetical protein